MSVNCGVPPRAGDGRGARMLIDGEWTARDEIIEVRNPFDGRLVDTVPKGRPEDIDAAITAATRAAERPWPTHARCDVLTRAAGRIEADLDGYARTIALEGSKTIREARREPLRCVALLRLAAEEGRRLAGETLPFDSRAGSENRVGYYFRFPVGVVGAITPFNDPLAMACHKVGPALAGGNAVVLKPGTATPLSALRLASDLMESGLPPGRLNVVTGRGEELGDALVADPRVRVVTFTGGVETGLRITKVAGIKKLCMELGSNSPVIVMPDANLERAVPAIAAGAFAQAGQNCLGVQRVIVLADVYGAFRERFVAHVRTLEAGSSMDEDTDVCAMITIRQAERVEAWIREAERGGARVLVGGRREGATVWPAVLESVPDGSRLDCEEVYGPVVSLYRADSLAEAIARANKVDYGLHAAIFTEHLPSAFEAIKGLHVGGVMVNDSTDYRLDVMPFGGTKLSGIGREGVRFALQEMTETRVVCFNL
jgi:glyceraldehyde-3-phosphate dehydrogenase (NADP+)